MGSDGNSVATSLNTVYATVTNDECVFVDFRTETSKALTCTYTGANRVTGVTFTLPDSRSVAGDPGTWGGGDTATPGTQTGSYTVTGITDASSGTYTCTFALDGGSSVSAVQRLTARKAVVVSSTGNLTPNLIVKSSITLTCTIASGARSIEWLKGDQVMTEGTDYTKLSAASESDDLVSKIEFDIEDDSEATYKCRGTQYDDFCSTPQQFESEDVVLTIIAAVPKQNPASATAYGGGSHKFTCKFPNPFVGQTYEIVWAFKGAGDSIAMPLIGNGDVYKDGERIVDGTQEHDHETTSGEIGTTLNIAAISSDAAGEYQCTVKWGTIFIESSLATLTVRTISEPPKITNVAKGGEAKLTCKTTGDAKSTITFHNADGDAEVGTVAQSDETDSGVVTTTGILTISNAQDANSLDYYCKAKWGDKEVKSGNVRLSVLGITAITSTAWGVATKSAQFECKSDALLKKNAAGDAHMNDEGKTVQAAATITWQYYDSASTSWKASTEDERFGVQNSLIGNNGIRVSPLFLRSLKTDEDGLKVRCNIAYQADAANNFFGGTVTSGDMVLKIAHVTSLTASDAGPITGATITLTCIATGQTAPNFKFSTSGRKTIDTTFFQEVQATAVTTVGTTHTAKYVTKTIAPNVLRSGQIIDCEADYGRALGRSEKAVTVTTYYDCSTVEVKSLNPADNGATIAATDNGDGTLTQKIT